MWTTEYRRRRLFLYLIPILMGMGGLLFSGQLENLVLRFSVILVSVTIPIFAGGNFLARHPTQGVEKILLVSGVLMLLLGAGVSLFIFSNQFHDEQFFPEQFTEVSRWLGILSLLLGLFVVLFSVVRTGAAIEEVGERFRHLAVHISEGFVLSSSDGTIVMVNQRFLDMLGLREEDVVGRNAGQLVTEHRASEMEPHLDLRAKGLASEYEISRVVHGEERQFWVSGTPIVDTFGRHTGTLATIRDMTEKNRMARRLERYAQGLQELVEEQTQKLRDSEQELRDLLMHMNEGFLAIDASYRIRLANKRICERLAVKASDIVDREIFDFIDPAGRVKLMNLLQSRAQDGLEAPRPELNFVSVEGAPVPVMVSMAPVQAGKGAGVRYSLVITDIGELKTMQRQLELRASELEVANQELRVLDRAKDSFLSNVSHELKTPLSTVNGYVEMLESLSLGPLNAPQQSALKVMGRNLKRLVSLINEMIEFSRMEIRGIHLQSSLFSVDRLIHESVASVQPHALAKDISIGIYCPEEMRPIWGDRGKLGQVLGILLNNAVKFSRDGGMIQINVTERSGNAVAIAVKDTGIGIDAAYHKRVFDKFFQVDGSISRRYEGTGIGLSIAKSVVEAHGGLIELDSQENVGCTFTVVLPGALFDLGASDLGSEALRGLDVLLVAEGAAFRNALCDVLTRCGCSVTEARNAFECVRLAEEVQPGIILFDEMDVANDSANAGSALRENPATSLIPIIIFAGDTRRVAGAPALSGPDTYVIAKPFDAAEMVRRIEAVLSGERPWGDGVPPTGGDNPQPVVLAVDGDTTLLEWIEGALRDRGIRCMGAVTVNSVLSLAEEYRPDMILLDGDQPPGTVRAALAAFHANEATRHVPVCLAMGRTSESSGIAASVSVIQKPFNAEDLAKMAWRLLRERTAFQSLVSATQGIQEQ